MNIGVDMDSVIAEIIRPIDLFHNKKYGTKLVYEDHITYNLQSLWQCSIEETNTRIFEFYHSPEFMAVQPIEGSQSALKALSRVHNLHLITSRPHDIENLTRQWIGTHFPHIFASITHTNQVSKGWKGRSTLKSAIGKELRINIMIDDHVMYALDCADHEILTLLFDAPWNRNYLTPHPHLRKVASWNEVCYTISHESQKPHHKD